jgi:beta-glucosidase/6-phospho-beta-glucosidase/beta-galactosidase
MKKSELRKVIRSIIKEVIEERKKKILSESKLKKGIDEVNFNEETLPDQFVKEMIRYADKFTPKLLKRHILECHMAGHFKTPNDLIKELKEFIQKDKHELFMEYVDNLLVKYQFKKPEVKKDQKMEKVKVKKLNEGKTILKEYYRTPKENVKELYKMLKIAMYSKQAKRLIKDLEKQIKTKLPINDPTATLNVLKTAMKKDEDFEGDFDQAIDDILMGGRGEMGDSRY